MTDSTLLRLTQIAYLYRNYYGRSGRINFAIQSLNGPPRFYVREVDVLFEFVEPSPNITQAMDVFPEDEILKRVLNELGL